ncbi:MAG: universal stress protein [Stenotrophomonas geniculata]
MFNTLLVALDGGPQHARVLDLAAAIAGPRSRLHLLCVLDPEFALAADASEADRIEYPEAARQRSRAEAVLAEALAELRERGVDAIAQIPSGDPGEVISDQARRLKCDLIVIGHRHLSRLERLFEPSIGQWTIDHAPAPCWWKPATHNPSCHGLPFPLVSHPGQLPCLRPPVRPWRAGAAGGDTPAA